MITWVSSARRDVLWLIGEAEGVYGDVYHLQQIPEILGAQFGNRGGSFAPIQGRLSRLSARVPRCFGHRHDEENGGCL